MALPRITLEGKLTADPVLTFRADGTPSASLSVVSADWRKGDQGWVSDTECSMDVVVLGRAAENVVESLRNGDLVIVAGTLRQHDPEVGDGHWVAASEVGPSLRFRVTPHSRDAEKAKPKV